MLLSSKNPFIIASNIDFDVFENTPPMIGNSLGLG